MSERKMVLRWTPLARITHWLLFLGVTVAIITGLPVLDGRLRFLYTLVGGETGRTILHYYFTTVVLGIAVPLVIARGIEAYRRGEESWWPGWADIRKGLVIAARWLKLTDKYPEIGFHHPMEKLLLISVHMGLLLLGISGIPMAILNIGPEYRALLLLIHDIGFLMVAVPIVGHFMLAINPVNWETLRAMFTHGKVSVEWAKHHHPGWKIEEQH
jgi:cytochrome b subunit of formate dehydrogenase